ncbi:MAG: hypothetical protein NXI28_12475 [bacterium]|nr:hypothetical protein [bacterium]
MTKTPQPINQTLKANELYFAFTGFDADDGTFGLLGYGDPERTPRIFCEGDLDGRLGNIPICEGMESAHERIRSGAQAVLVRLSAIMDGSLLACFRPYEVRQWASAQRDVEPDAVLEYVAKWIEDNPPECCHDNKDSVVRQVVFDNTSWIRRNPNGTLEELLDFLDSVRYEMRQYDGDELIADHIDDLCDAAVYLADFGDDEDDDLPDFDYRMDNINEDIEHVEELIAFDGESFKVADLPKKDDLLNRRVAG